MTEYRLLTNAEELPAACEELSRHAALGFDTETTSLDPYAGRLRLIQLAAPGSPVYLFDLDRLAPNSDTAKSDALAPLRELLAAPRPIKIAHNCLAGDMLVSMADGTKVRIDKLVRAKTRSKVLCIDEKTRTLSTGEIVGWVDGGVRPWDDWLRICMRGKGILRVTKDHQVLTERGRIRAENLVIGDKVLTSLPELAQPQRELLYGSLLGDGSLTKQRTAQARTPHFKVSHSLNQEGYVALKAAALDGLVKLIKTEKVHYRGFSNSAGGSQLISLTTKSDPRLFEFYDNCLMRGKRTLTPRWLDNLSMPALAVWYCDDGTLARGSSASLCVSALGTEGADMLVEFLRSKGFPAKLWMRTDGQLYVKVVGPYGRGMSEELKRFWESIAPYVPVSMQYKLPVAYKHLASDRYWTTTPAPSKAFSDIVVEILPLLNDSSERGRYDGYRRGKRRGLKQYCLTVATHQNFVAGGLAVSNCKFDAKWIKRQLGAELGGLFDTLLASQLISAGETEDRHGLAVVAERYLGQTVDKTEQLSDWGGELSASQLEYAARDAAVMLPLRDALIKRLKSDELIKVAQIEFECVMPVAELELAGIFLDAGRWREQIAVVKRERARVAAELQAMLAVGTMQASLFADARADINIDSHTQLSAALKRLGVPVPDSTRNWKLQPLAAEWPVVAKLLEYRTMQKSLTSYGENIIGEINPQTGRIHANFHQIGAPTGRFACLAGDTLVPTSDGFKRMDALRAGELVKTSDGFKRVTRAWMTGVRQLYRVQLRDGRSLRATKDHKFLTGRADTWKELGELKAGDPLFVSLKEWVGEPHRLPRQLNVAAPDVRARKPVTLPRELSVELCELMGLIIADGFLGQRHERAVKLRRLAGNPAVYDRVYLALNRQDSELRERVIAHSLKLFGQPFVSIKSKTCDVMQLPSTLLAEFLARLGLTGNAHTKTVPDVILSALPIYQAAFLRGLFEGDGNRQLHSIGLTSVNHRLLSQAQLMLSNMGIYSVIRQRQDTSGFAGAVRYDLKIYQKAELVKFMERVSFLTTRKNFPITFVPQHTDGITTPFVVSGARLYREAVTAGTTESSRKGVQPFATFYKSSYIKDVTVGKLVSRFGLLPSLKPVADYLAREVRSVAIESITTDRSEEVYDITVEDVHEFVANGIVVHNCTNPNIQQVPHAVEYRRCFRAPEGRKLCIADFSQIELRILAHITGDQGFIDAFNSGADLHRTTAAQVFNVPLDQVTKDQRDFAKRLNFGVVYGIGAQRFSMLTGLPLSDAESIMARYFQTYRGLDAWLREAARKAVRERQARTLSGRLNRFNFDPEDRQAVSLVQRNGKNMPIQGCVSGETRVFEESVGYVSIRSLEGKSVSVWDGARFAKAQVADSGIKQLVRVEFWGGNYIECSPEHKFLTTDVNGRTKWRTPGEFVKGNYVAVTEPLGAWTTQWRFPKLVVGRAHNASRSSLADAVGDAFGLGVWLGRLASDGTVTERQLNLLVAQHEEIILPQIRALCEQFGHVSYRTQRGGKGEKLLHSLTISALGLVTQLRESGLKSRVPDFAWQDSRLLAGYLRGMFGGDGTVTSDGPALCFGQGRKHLAWAREIQQALLLFGIEGRINVCADRINVCVRKRDARLFAERIGFINPLKQSKVRSIYSLKPEGQIYGRAMRIKSIEVTDEWVEMYDVIDSETGRFMANGLITHNSSADILKRALRLLHDKLRETDACLVNIVHDEIVVEANEQDAAEIAGMIEDAMCRAGAEFITRVPIKVESQVADEWVK